MAPIARIKQRRRAGWRLMSGRCSDCRRRRFACALSAQPDWRARRLKRARLCFCPARCDRRARSGRQHVPGVGQGIAERLWTSQPARVPGDDQREPPRHQVQNSSIRAGLLRSSKVLLPRPVRVLGPVESEGSSSFMTPAPATRTARCCFPGRSPCR